MRFLAAAGLSTLSIDFRGHGESPGEKLTFGHLEAHDARAAVDYLRERCPDARIAVIGESLGGAACLLGDGYPRADAFVFENVYADLRSAVRNRVAVFLGPPLATLISPLLTVQCEWRLGVGIEEMCPIKGIARLDAPVFILGGELNRRTPPEETRSQFDAARRPKQLWIVPGAGHFDLHSHVEYEKRVLAFLREHLEL